MDQNFSSDSRKRVSENSKLIQKTDLAALALFFDSPLNFRRPFSGKSRRPYIGKDPIPFLLIAPRASSLPSPLSSPSPSPYPFPSYRSLWVGPGPLTALILTAFGARLGGTRPALCHNPLPFMNGSQVSVTRQCRRTGRWERRLSVWDMTHCLL